MGDTGGSSFELRRRLANCDASSLDQTAAVMQCVLVPLIGDRYGDPV